MVLVVENSSSLRFFRANSCCHVKKLGSHYNISQNAVGRLSSKTFYTHSLQRLHDLHRFHEPGHVIPVFAWRSDVRSNAQLRRCFSLLRIRIRFGTENANGSNGLRMSFESVFCQLEKPFSFFGLDIIHTP